MHATNQCHERDVLIGQIRTITDEIVALETSPTVRSPHQLQLVRQRRERLLKSYGEHVASHGCTDEIQHAVP